MVHAQSPTTAVAGVDVYSPSQLREMGASLAAEAAASGSASKTLERYPGHYTMLAYRSQSGGAEVHEKFADMFVIVEGSATLLSGGNVVAPQTTGPGEIRGTAIEHANERAIHPGDVVHIPAGVPHLLKLEKGAHLLYFVVKVQESPGQ